MDELFKKLYESFDYQIDSDTKVRLQAVPEKKCCDGCFFNDETHDCEKLHFKMYCTEVSREDRKSVIFKQVE
jgi:hypothetical protein